LIIEVPELLNVEVPELLIRVAVAFATGGLIGLERERRPQRKFAGLRTLTLLCGSGPIVVSIAETEGYPLLFAVYLLLAGAIALSIAYIRFSLNREKVGFTTSITVFFVALLGLLIGYGRLFESTSIAIAIAFILAERQRLHRYVDKVDQKELVDSLTLGALVFILYPILPTEPVDPYGILVLRDVLLFAIFVLLIQFLAYISMQQFGGSRGLAVTGLLAGGANSFATAGILARTANRSTDAIDAASVALLLATLSMIGRNIGLAVVLAVGIFWSVWQPAVVMTGLSIVFAGLLWHRGEIHDEFDFDFGSPFSLRAAMKFSVAYVVILFVSVGAETLIGDVGLYAAAFAGGLVSSAAVSVTAATVFNGGTATADIAAGIVIVGIVASLVSKIALVEFVNGKMRKRALLPMAAVGVAGLAVFLVS